MTIGASPDKNSQPAPAKTKQTNKRKRLLQRPWVVAILARAIRGYIAFAVGTSRKTLSVPAASQALFDGEEGFIMTSSHGRIMGLPILYNRFGPARPLFGLHSGHRDGQLVGAVVSGYRNIGTIEGSSTRGGAKAIRAIRRALDDGAIVLITPDGPRGPRLRNRSATGEIAREARCPILTVSVSSRRGRFLGTWDRFLLLIPFDHIQIVVSEPIAHQGLEREAARALIEQNMIVATQTSDTLASRVAIEPV